MTRVGLWLLALCGLAGQETPRTPAAGAAPQEPQPAAVNNILHNTGRPLALPFQCTNDDIQWAGLSCTDDEPCPVYLELSAVESLGNKVFAAGNIHSSDATLYSVLLASDDAGKTWHEPYERLRGASLDHIQFIDFENGWISGQTVQPLPQDPFLLITSDGGKTWRQRPLFTETRAGAILQFWFSSRNNGTLILDRGQSGDLGRYELYETPNGGETWVLHEANERLMKMKRTASGNADWRVRADASTKSFIVERRQGERWSSLSAFAVALAPCKPSVEAVPEPATQEAAGTTSAPAASPAKPPTLKRPPK